MLESKHRRDGPTALTTALGSCRCLRGGQLLPHTGFEYLLRRRMDSGVSGGGSTANGRIETLVERENMAELMDRITVDPEQCGGRPCIRGMRIRVSDVLDLLANGLSAEEIIEEMPDLEPEDVRASLRFASRRLDHPVVAA